MPIDRICAFCICEKSTKDSTYAQTIPATKNNVNIRYVGRTKLSDEIARELRILKARHGITNAQIAVAVAVSETTISKMLAGTQRLDIDLAVSIVQGVGDSVPEFFQRASERWEKQK